GARRGAAPLRERGLLRRIAATRLHLRATETSDPQQWTEKKASKELLGTKPGMAQGFEDEDQAGPVTVLRTSPCPEIEVRSTERDGNEAVQLGFGTVKRVNKPRAGHFAKAGIDPTRWLVEVQLAGEHAPGDAVTVDQFRAGEYVDVTGTSKGKG